MNLFLTVLEIVAPVFILASIGFAWVKLGFEYRMQFVTGMAMSLSVPCLIFVSMMKTEIDPKALTAISLAALVTYVAITIVMWGVLRLRGLSMQSYLAPLVFGNTGNVGLPLALFAFGAQGLDFAIVVFAIMVILNFTFGIWVLTGGGAPWLALKQPSAWAAVLGALFMWQGWETPAFITNSLDLIAQLAIPMMLITLGVAVARLTPGRIGQAIWMSALKAVVCVGGAAIIGAWFELPHVAWAALILQIGTPVAVTSYMLAARYGGDDDAVAGLVVVSTLMAVIVIPLTLGFLI